MSTGLYSNSTHDSQVCMVIHRPDQPRVMKVAYLDTGAMVNVIRRGVVDKFGFEMQPYHGKTLDGFGSKDIVPQGQIWIEWHANERARNYETLFLVVEDHILPTDDIIIGDPEIKRIGFFIKNTRVYTIQYATVPVGKIISSH